MHEIEQVQEILRSCLSTIKRRRRKKWWKALLGISIDRGKSPKTRGQVFFKLGGIDEDESLRYISKEGIRVKLVLVGIKLGLAN